MSHARGRGPTIAKDINRKGVYLALKKSGSSTRAALAAMLGLNKNTVNAIVDELIAAGYVRETGAQTAPGAGRRAIGIEFAAASRLVVGVQITNGALFAVVADLYAQPLRTFELPLPDMSPDAVVAAIGNLLGQIAAVYPPANLLGLGCGIPALLDAERAVVAHSSHLGWNDVPFRELLRPVCPTEPLIDNSVKLAAFGEMWHGAADFAYCSFGIGVGGGLVVQGRLLRGHSELAGELGHLVVDPAGPRCACGNTGCLEALVGLPAIYARLAAATGIAAGEWDPAGIAGRARSGHPAVLNELARVGQWIGEALSHLVTLLNPQAIIFDGPLMAAADWLLPVVRDTLQRRALVYTAQDVRITCSALAPWTGAIGAAAAVVARFEHRDQPLEPMTF